MGLFSNNYLASLISEYLFSIFSNNSEFYNHSISAINKCLKLDDYIVSPVESLQYSIVTDTDITIKDFQTILSKINEKENRRKKDGVFYTPSDVTYFITINSFLNFLKKDNEEILTSNNYERFIESLSDKDCKKIIKAKIFEPTCGAGEFLITALDIKLKCLFRLNPNYTDSNIIAILKSLYGNDISLDSVNITKARIFCATSVYLKSLKSFDKLAETLNTNFFSFDFVKEYNQTEFCFDVILGNPPYVEYSSKDNLSFNNFGNLYADVILNSTSLLTTPGVIGFIIPISYISTPRMSSIREEMNKSLKKQFLLNYADRPDCLFVGVHQKLTILIGTKKASNRGIYTSMYRYWYKDERYSLFETCEIIKNDFTNKQFIPKIGNPIEYSILKKCFAVDENESLFKLVLPKSDKTNSIFLNMRGCFWTKVFDFNPGSNEYKQFSFSDEIQPYILCLLNSSLFFFFWIAISDCWHITLKELRLFKAISENVDFTMFDSLSKELLAKLESTKKYVGTKQTLYEYKHRDCKDVIDKIDRTLKNIYNLTDEELSYLIDFKLKYRISDGK